MVGTLEKTKTKYRTDVLKNVKSNHPIRHGVHMQAHHIISGDACESLSRDIEVKIVQNLWDINRPNNVALIPSTLIGACHLGVQPHIGNHSAKVIVDDDNDDDDDVHEETYHETVRKLVVVVAEDFPDCGDNMSEIVIKKMDKLSKLILKKIQNDTLSLTSVSGDFCPGDNPIGCGDQENIDYKVTRKSPCSSIRNHEGQENPRNKGDLKSPKKISKKLSAVRGSYQLEVGGGSKNV